MAFQNSVLTRCRYCLPPGDRIGKLLLLDNGNQLALLKSSKKADYFGPPAAGVAVYECRQDNVAITTAATFNSAFLLAPDRQFVISDEGMTLTVDFETLKINVHRLSKKAPSPDGASSGAAGNSSKTTDEMDHDA